MITIAQRNELMTDWFTGRDKNFTKINTTKFIGSTSKITKYPFLSRQGNDMKFVFGKIYFMGKSMLDAMNFKQKYILKVSHNTSDSYTDGHKIFISSDYFDSNALTLPQKLDTFLGVVIHEGLHCKYTQFGIDIPKTYNETEQQIIHFFRNVYEDERIEWLCGEHMPGYIEYIGQLKDYFFNILYQEKYRELDKKLDTTTEKLVEIFTLCVLRSVRYPSMLEESHVDYVGEYLLQVKEMLVNNFPKSTQDSHDLAIKTFELVKDFILDKQGLPNGASSQQQTSEELDNNSILKELLKQLVEMTSTNIVNGSQSPSDTEEQINTSVTQQNRNMIFEELEGIVETADNQTYFFKTVPDVANYTKVFNEIKQYIPRVRNTLTYHDKHQKLKHKSMFNGSLDTSKLVDSRCGVSNVYEKQGLVETEKIAVCFNIDLSGSMHGEKIQQAQRTAILLYEAFRYNKSIELFIYGHTADNISGQSDGHTSIYTFFEPKLRNAYTLGSIESMDCNRDGIAILEVAKRVRQQTKRKCLMFVISDGQPNARHYSGSPAIMDTKQKVLQVERTMNMDVMQIAIESSHDPALMFDKFIKFDSIENLPSELNKFIKTTLLKKQGLKYS